MPTAADSLNATAVGPGREGGGGADGADGADGDTGPARSGLVGGFSAGASMAAGLGAGRGVEDRGAVRAEVRGASAPAWGGLLNPLAMLRGLWSHRDLARQFAWREVRKRTQETNLGLWWHFAQPLIRLALFTLVFAGILDVRWPDAPGSEKAWFVLKLFTGLLVFGVFQDLAVRAPTLVLDRPNLVTKVVFPLEVLVVAALLAELVTAGVCLVVLLLGQAALLRELHATALLVPVLVLPPLAAWSLGVGWFLSAVGVYLRDTKQLAQVLIGQLLFFLTPVFYPLERVPDAVRPVIELNPMTTLVETARGLILTGAWPDWRAWSVVTLAGCVVMVGGYAVFMRLKRGFADVV